MSSVERKKEDGELNKSVPVQGIPPCLTLLQEMQEMWGGGGGRPGEKESGGALQDATTSFGATKQDEAINSLLLFRLPARTESPFLCVF